MDSVSINLLDSMSNKSPDSVSNNSLDVTLLRIVTTPLSSRTAD